LEFVESENLCEIGEPHHVSDEIHDDPDGTHTVFPMKQLTVWPHHVSSETIACDDDTHTVFPVK